MNNFTIIVIIYLCINCILSIVSKSLIDRAERYWARKEDAPDDFLTLILLYPNFMLSKHISRKYGYVSESIRIVWLILTLRKHKIFERNKKWNPLKFEIIFGIILIIAFLPIFIVGIVSETYWVIYSYRMNKKDDEEK